MRRLMFVVGLSILLVFPVFGQIGRGRARLTGIVTDDDGNPIAAAKITLRFIETIPTSLGRAERPKEPVTLETAANEKGKWSITGLGTGIWLIAAAAKGYHPASRECTVHQLQPNPVVPLQLEKEETFATEKWKSLTESELLEKANELYYLRRYDEAITLYESYLRVRPDDLMVALSVGNCLAEKGDFDAAIARFATVVKKASKDPTQAFIAAKAFGDLGEVYWMKKDSGKAEESFRLALEKGAENEQWAFNIAEICFARGAMDDAVVFYQKAAGFAPSWSDPEYKLGLAYLNKGNRPRARGHFEKFLRLEPDSARSAEVKKILKDLG